MGEKLTYLMSKSWNPMLSALTDEELGCLMKAIISYQSGNEVEVDNPLLQAMLEMILAYMKKNDAAYEETCEKRKAAGSLGGKSKAAKSKQEVALATKSKQSLANLADKDKEKDKDKDINIKNPKGLKREDAIVDESDLSDSMKQVVKEWLQYKRERKDKLTEVGTQQLVGRIKNKVQAFGELPVADVIYLSMSQGWQGIIWDKIDIPPKPKPKPNNFTGRSYDFDELERQVAGNG